MKELKRETTIAKRFPAALRLPSTAGTPGWGGCSSFIFSFVAALRTIDRIVVETRLAASPAAKRNEASLVSTPDLSYFPLNAAGRFSRNAAVPSFLSSVAQQSPNKAASR